MTLVRVWLPAKIVFPKGVAGAGPEAGRQEQSVGLPLELIKQQQLLTQDKFYTRKLWNGEMRMGQEKQQHKKTSPSRFSEKHQAHFSGLRPPIELKQPTDHW